MQVQIDVALANGTTARHRHHGSPRAGPEAVPSTQKLARINESTIGPDACLSTFSKCARPQRAAP